GRLQYFANQAPGAQNAGVYLEYGANLRNTFTSERLGEMVVGSQYIAYRNDSPPVYPVPYTTNTDTAAYMDFRPRLAASPNTHVSFGGRADFGKSSGTNVIWKASARQDLAAGVYLRAAGGTAFSLPLITELYIDSPTQRGTPDLKP